MRMENSVKSRPRFELQNIDEREESVLNSRASGGQGIEVEEIVKSLSTEQKLSLIKQL